MNNFLDLIFKLVSSLIGIYVVAHYLTWINVFDKKKRQLYVTEGIDTDTIAYCLLYLLALVSTGSFVTYEKWSISPFFLLPLSLIIAFISQRCFKKEKKSNVASVVFSLFNGAMTGLVLCDIVASYTNNKPDFIAYLVIVAMNFIITLVLVGRLRITDKVYVQIYIQNKELVDLFSIKDATPNNSKKDDKSNSSKKDSNLTCIVAILIDEKDDHYFIEVADNNELYRLPKDQVVLLKAISQ